MSKDLKLAVLWILPLILILLDFSLASAFLSTTDTASYDFRVEFKYLITWLENGKWNGMTVPEGSSITIKSSIFRIGSGCAYCTTILKDGKLTEIPVGVICVTYPLIEMKHHKVVHREFLSPSVMCHQEFERYFKDLLFIPTNQLLFLRSVYYGLIDMKEYFRSDLYKYKSGLIDSDYLISVFYNATKLTKGEFNVSLNYIALLYVISPYEIYFNSCKIPMYEFRVRYENLSLIRADVYSYRPRTIKLKLRIPALKFVSFMKSHFTPILSIAIILTVVYLVYPETRRFLTEYLSKHWRKALTLIGIVLIFSALVVRVGHSKLSYSLVLVKGVLVNKDLLPLFPERHFELKGSANMTVEVSYHIFNDYPHIVQSYIMFRAKKDDKIIRLRHSLITLDQVDYFGYGGETSWRVSLDQDKLNVIWLNATCRKLNPYMRTRYVKEFNVIFINYTKGAGYIRYKPLLFINQGLLHDPLINIILALIGSLVLGIALGSSLKKPSAWHKVLIHSNTT